MKKRILIILLVSLHVFSQQNETYKSYINQLKKESKIDGGDRAVFHLLDEFYMQVLQSDAGEFSPGFAKKIENLYQNKKTKNRHLLIMFLTYQDHITKTAAVGKSTNPIFQVDLMTDLENEFQSIFNEIPAIIYIYTVEAYISNVDKARTLNTIEKGLKAYPDAVPLKVYKYLETNSDEVKKDLITNHANHWMVKQFEIH